MLSRVWRQRKREITPAQLRAEGVVELGGASGTSVLYVRTPGRLYLFHVEYLKDRALDAYAVALAVNWIENGFTSAEVARNLSVSETTLRNALSAAGYERLSAPQIDQLRHARMAYRLGNRKGRLVARRPDEGAAP